MSSSALNTNASELPSVGVLGVGQLAQHLVEGFCGATVTPNLLLSPRSSERAEALAKRFSLEIATDNQSVVDRSDLVILSVPTDQAVKVASALNFDERQVVVCVAAGLKREPLAKAASPAKTVRAMPPTSASVRESATALYPGDDRAERTLGLVGTVHVFDDEGAFEVASITAVYYGWVFALMGEISGWLESKGIEDKEAKNLVAQMTRGACAMCVEGGKDMAREDRVIGRRGTYTGMGLDLLRRMDAFSAWSETLDAVLEASCRGKSD
jgi:pyrroline-5-carboxylate reductase